MKLVTSEICLLTKQTKQIWLYFHSNFSSYKSMSTLSKDSVNKSSFRSQNWTGSQEITVQFLPLGDLGQVAYIPLPWFPTFVMGIKLSYFTYLLEDTFIKACKTYTDEGHINRYLFDLCCSN